MKTTRAGSSISLFNSIKKRAVFCLFICLGLGALLCGCSDNQVVTRSDFAMDTVVTITAYGETDQGLLDTPFNVIRQYNDQLDAFSADSEISRINAAAGVSPVVVSEDTYNLIAEALSYSQLTNGAFDITVGPLVDLWGIGEPETKEAPSADAVSQAQAKVDYRKVVLNPDDHSVYLSESGMAINLGAVAKGFIGDKVRDSMQDEDIQHAIANLGGNVVLVGGRSNLSDFNVGVTDPADPEGDPIGVLRTRDTAVVTSGDYQRYFTDSQGKKYHHILDARTGYPCDNDLHQVTVVCSSSTQADALSTSLFLMGSEKAMAYIEKTDGVEGILVTTDGRVEVSKGLANTFIFDSGKKSDTYTLVTAQ